VHWRAHCVARALRVLVRTTRLSQLPQRCGVGLASIVAPLAELGLAVRKANAWPFCAGAIASGRK
jgi:hypothetical protein